MEVGASDDDGLAEEVGDGHLHEHVVHGEHPLAVVELDVLLLHLEVFHEVDIAPFGQGEVAFLHVQRGVGNDEEFSPEAEVLLVVGSELQVVAQVLSHVGGVLNVEAVEGDGILSYGAGEMVLQQPHLVVVDVHISKDVLEQRVEDVSRLDELVDAGTSLSGDDVLGVFGVFAVDVLRDGLVDGERQDEFVVEGAQLHLVHHPLLLLLLHLLQLRWRDVVDSEGDFLVFVILVEIVVGEVGAFLGLHHPFHQLHGGVVLSAVLALPLGLDDHLVEFLRLRLEIDDDVVGCVLLDGDVLCAVSHRFDGEHPSVVPLDGEASVRSSCDSHLVPLVDEAGKGYGVAAEFVEDDPRELCVGRECQHPGKDDGKYVFSRFLHLADSLPSLGWRF